jgi:hypothetical protein
MVDSRTCKSGHANPIENQHCGTCGTALDVLSDEASPPSPATTAAASSNRWIVRNLAIVAAVILVVVGGLWIFGRGSSGAREGTADDAVDRVARECEIDVSDLNAEFEGYWDATTGSYTDSPDETDQSVFFVYSKDPDQLGKAVVRLPGLVETCPEEASIAGG